MSAMCGSLWTVRPSTLSKSKRLDRYHKIDRVHRSTVGHPLGPSSLRRAQTPGDVVMVAACDNLAR